MEVINRRQPCNSRLLAQRPGTASRTCPVSTQTLCSIQLRFSRTHSRQCVV